MQYFHFEVTSEILTISGDSNIDLLSRSIQKLSFGQQEILDIFTFPTAQRFIFI